MVGIVLVTHNELGKALLESARFVTGEPLEAAEAVSINLMEPAKKLRAEIAAAVKKVSDKEGVLILTDMFGGTPSNLGYSFLEEGRIEVLSGVNLPVLLRAAAERGRHENLKDLAREVEAYGKESISLASDILKGNKRNG